ncbi:hypothetical protein L248_2566 [Schleiferilactobacillus shenzhenensis LY-73]|uniref:Uncharacterized protein n=1 Tax=Schleiferilactobacillus shenzhenensis LY-73 TaxID=1231336 RepID=U4TUD8_9LACO|nr:hypothetical protein L248_2566 [Schleiferilactobacillus shenzhenensis LY-73]
MKVTNLPNPFKPRFEEQTYINRKRLQKNSLFAMVDERR